MILLQNFYGFFNAVIIVEFFYCLFRVINVTREGDAQVRIYYYGLYDTFRWIIFLSFDILIWISKFCVANDCQLISLFSCNNKAHESNVFIFRNYALYHVKIKEGNSS